MPLKQKTLLGQMLVTKGIISDEDLEFGLREQKKSRERIGAALVKMGVVDQEAVLKVLAEQLGIPFVKPSELEIGNEVINKIPAKFVHHYQLIPIKMQDKLLQIAMSDPLDVHTVDDISLLLDIEVDPTIATPEEIAKAIKKYYGIGGDTLEQMMESDDFEDRAAYGGAVDASSDMAEEEATIIKFVNQIITEAFKERATDIHLEPYADEFRVRYRIDGMLYEANIPSTIRHFQDAIISRIKVMGDMNIAERRLPQDGRIEMKLPGTNANLDLRVSSIPTPFGESISIRLLNRSSILFGLEELGLIDDSLDTLKGLISRPNGIILITGPTGSGKTTTLYSCLSRINSIDKKIITIEDPIEYQLKGISQIQVIPQINLNFARCLRAILRHDPDIIMVGEIRDHETAEITIQTALTGHLVFSTLHTNDAAGSVTRMLDMGIEPFLVSSSVIGMIAQRLVRLICPNCKREEKVEPDLEALMLKDAPEFAGRIKSFRGAGCEACRYTGFHGRTGIYEMITVNEEIRNLIMDRAPATRIKAQARAMKMTFLRQDGWKKVCEGLTTVDEVLRVTQEVEDF